MGDFLELDEDGIGGDLAQNVGDEEHHVGDVVVVAFHLEIGFEALDFGVAQVGSNDGCQQSSRGCKKG